MSDKQGVDGRVDRRGIAFAGGEMPSLAFLLSAFAPIIAAVIRIAAPEVPGAYNQLIWLLGLFPVFMLTRYMGWRGTLLALVWTGVLVVLAELFIALLIQRLPDWNQVGAVVAILAAAGLGAGLEQQWWQSRLAAAAATDADDELSPLAEGLPPRDVLDYFLSKVFAGARRQPPLSIVLLQIDRHQELEEMYGRRAVSQAMAVATECLKRHVRAMNVFGRHGEHTLLVLLQGEGLTAANAVTRRVLEEIAGAPVPWKGRMTLSAGIAGFEPGIEHPDTLTGFARRALEGAQRLGGNSAVVYHGNVDETLVAPGMLVMEPDGQIREIHRSV